jgi:cell division septum initiation protein DivIVA
MCRPVGILPERIMTTPIPLTDALTAVQNGTLAQAIADVCAERDRLRKENAILQEANRGLVRQCEELRAALASANALIGSTAEECKGIVSQCEKERDRLRARAEAMRSALEGLKHADGCYCDAAFAMPGTIVKHYDECLAAQAALATDAGKAPSLATVLDNAKTELAKLPDWLQGPCTERYVPHQEYEALKAQNAAMRDNLTSIAEAKLAWEHVKDDVLIAAIGELALSALSTDSRKGYVPAGKARVIAEALLKSYEFISTAERFYGREPAWIMAGGPSLIPQLEADLAIARELGLLEAK